MFRLGIGLSLLPLARAFVVAGNGAGLLGGTSLTRGDGRMVLRGGVSTAALGVVTHHSVALGLILSIALTVGRCRLILKTRSPLGY